MRRDWTATRRACGYEWRIEGGGILYRVARWFDNIGRMSARQSDPFTVLVERDDEGYFVATVPELRGCHTQAKSLDALTRRVTEAITLCLADGPRQPRRHFVAVQQVRVP